MSRKRSTVYGRRGSSRSVSSAANPQAVSFYIWVPDEELVGEGSWIDRRLLPEQERQGWMRAHHGVTAKGWEALNAGRDKMESNLLEWLNRFFVRAELRGEKHGMASGTVWVDPKDQEQVYVAEHAYDDGLSISDDFPTDMYQVAFKGVNEFAKAVLGSPELSASVTFERKV